jgi:hypothetical protein
MLIIFANFLALYARFFVERNFFRALARVSKCRKKDGEMHGNRMPGISAGELFFRNFFPFGGDKRITGSARRGTEAQSQAWRQCTPPV